MKRKKIIKISLIVISIALLAGVGGMYYMFNMPHRDIQASKTDFSLTATALVNEYLTAPEAADQKYLDEEGESKILAVSGKVSSITEDLNHQKVVLLKNDGDKAGVSCTFTAETNAHAQNLQVGQTITVKGVIRSGAGYDEDLDLYEHVILEKCDLINK